MTADTCGCKWTGVMSGYSWQNIFGNNIVTGDTCVDSTGVHYDGYAYFLRCFIFLSNIEKEKL